MKIGIVVGGRFVAFDTARALLRRDAFAGIVSAFVRANRMGIPRELLRWNPFLGVAFGLQRRWSRRPSAALDFTQSRRFGRWAARHLPEADCLQLWSGYALETLERRRSARTLRVLVRTSAHIRVQERLLREEWDAYGMPGEPVDPRMLEREEAEYAAADAISVPSRFAARSFIEQGVPEERLVVTPLATERASHDAVRRAAATRAPLRALFLGGLTLQKGAHYLLRAVGRLGAGRVHLTLVGARDAEGEQILARDGRIDRLEVRDPVGRDEIGALFAANDVLVLPSVHDGFGAVICEAMAAGLPVIATTNTGGPDVIRHGVDGLIVPARDTIALADALEYLAADPGRREEMGRAAATVMREERTWDAYAGQLLEQYAAARARLLP